MKLPQIVVLAGGLATRLRPITEKIPKSLFEINGTPFVLYQMDLLRRAGFEEILFCVGHLHEKIESFLEDGRKHGVRISYSIEAELLGTAGALKLAQSKLEDDFFLMYGDSYVPIDFYAAYQEYLMAKKEALVVVYKNKNKYDRSNMVVINNKIKVYNKNSIDRRMGYIDSGVSILNKSVLMRIKNDETYDLVSLYNELIRENELAAYETKQRFYEIGSFAGIKEFEGIAGNILKGAKKHAV